MSVSNNWWAGDSRERFWVEITNRDDVGGNLVAPQLNDAGKSEWSYELLRSVRPGDIVLHWQKDAGALTSYSRCVQEAFPSSLEWQSRGSYGRKHQPVGLEDAWEVPLVGVRQLHKPVPLRRLRDLEPKIRGIRENLRAIHPDPLYFPFALSDKRPLRAAQAYLVKFPADLVEAIPELRELGQLAVDGPGSVDTPKNQSPKASGGYGRQSDPERRKAIERYSVGLVREHFESLGFQTFDVGAHEPWDVTAERGAESIHIEVKGSTTDRDAIDITEGEVRHAEGSETLLIVIDRIHMDSALECSGGRWRHWHSWSPDRDQLMPTAYRHRLPEGAIEGLPSFTTR